MSELCVCSGLFCLSSLALLHLGNNARIDLIELVEDQQNADAAPGNDVADDVDTDQHLRLCCVDSRGAGETYEAHQGAENSGQFKVMDKIPQYQQCEVHNLVEAPAEVPEVLRHVVFNIERGQTLHETIDFLNMCPDFKNIDIIYANELDDGAVRSGNCNVAYEIAKSIGMNYAYGLEFIELVNPDDNKGFHGNALFSRWPIRWAKVVHMPEQYNWYYDRQKRIGARVAIVCSLDIGGREVGAVSVHLENRADSEGREAQMAVVYDEIKKSFAPDTPVMIGGDLNTNTFDGNDIPGFTKLFNDPERLAKHMAAVEKYERVLPQAEENGFSYREFSSTEGTRRKPMPGGKSMLLKLDWLMARGMECVDHGTVSTETKDCTWAEPGSTLAKFTGPELSDHNACWADCRFVK